MKRCVIDASLIAAAMFQEEFEEPASALLASNRIQVAPAIIFAEVCNVIWKRFRRKEISEVEAGKLLAGFLHLPLRITSSEKLIESALQIAMQYDRTAYDSLYIALAVKTDAVMVTADKRLVKALAGGPLEKYVRWLGEVK
jgi:predicted nucleic acid-binding protein